MAKHTMALGQRIHDAGYEHTGTIVMRKLGDQYFILEGYENNEGLLDYKMLLTKDTERIYVADSGGFHYTWTDDYEVTQLGSTLIAPKLAIHEGFPHKQSFVATWFSKPSQALFTASFHYNEEEDQLYTYDHGLDEFVPECDHGYTPAFFEKVGATFFVTGDKDA